MPFDRRPDGYSSAASAPVSLARRLSSGFGSGRWRGLFVPNIEDDGRAPFLFLPIAFGLGAGIYFASGPDNAAPLASLAALVFAGLSVFVRHRFMLFWASVLIAATAFGHGQASRHTASYSVLALQDRTGAIKLVGILERLEYRGEAGARLWLRAERLVGDWPFGEAETVLVRLNQAAGLIRTDSAQTGLSDVLPGDRIEVRGMLFPLSGPTVPGGYDFRFWSHFKGLSATGRVFAAPEIVSRAEAATLGIWVERMRLHIRARIFGVLGDTQAAALTTALITGQRGDIPEGASDALRGSGLAHILAISGLHMALVAGGFFAAMRIGLARIPGVATRISVRRVAAIGALGVASGYLLLSGMSVASQRAYVMIAIFFVAVLLDRQAVTLRNVAIAAMIVLTIAPENVRAAGFHMSFAATVALVAGYRHLSRLGLPVAGYHSRRHASTGLTRFGRAMAISVLGIAITSIVAGLATGPFAAFHFNRIAVFGVIANVAAMPILTFWVMPLALISVVLMPLGLETITLTLMAPGIDVIVAIAVWTAELPGAVQPITAKPNTVLLLTCVAMGAVFLFRKPLVGTGALALLVAAFLDATNQQPEVFINRTGQSALARTVDGSVQALSPRLQAFPDRVWRQRAGLGTGAPETRPGQCDSLGCTVTTSSGHRVAYSSSPQSLAEDCAKAAVIVTTYEMTRARQRICGRTDALLIDRIFIERSGAIALSVTERDPAVWHVHTAYTHQRRPWQPLNSDE